MRSIQLLFCLSYSVQAALQVVREYQGCTNNNNGEDSSLRVFLPNGQCNLQASIGAYYTVSCSGELEFWDDNICTVPTGGITPQVGTCDGGIRLACELHDYVTETKYFGANPCAEDDILIKNFILETCTQGVTPSKKFVKIDATSFKIQEFSSGSTCGGSPTETTYNYGQCYQLSGSVSVKYVASDTFSPSQSPSKSPTVSPSTGKPTKSPSKNPTVSTPTKSPTSSPASAQPTKSPSNSKPTKSPSSSKPTNSPTTPTSKSPTTLPTIQPTTISPSKSPVIQTNTPTRLPTLRPTIERTFLCAGYWGDPHLKRTKITNGAVVETWPVQDCGGSGLRVLAKIPGPLSSLTVTISVSQTFQYWGPTISTIDKLIIRVGSDSFQRFKQEIGFDFPQQFSENMLLGTLFRVTSFGGLPSGYKSVHGYKFTYIRDENFLLELRMFETNGNQRFMNVYLCAEQISSGLAKDGCATSDIISTNTLNSDGREGRLLTSSLNRRNRILTIGNFSQCDGLFDEDLTNCANAIASSNQTVQLNVTAQPACDNVPEDFQLACDLDVQVTNDTTFANLTNDVSSEIQVLEGTATNFSSVAATDVPTTSPTSQPKSLGQINHSVFAYNLFLVSFLFFLF